MPNYHLNIYNDADVPDNEGADFADLSAAKDAAIRGARAMMAEHVASGHPIDLSDRIEISDDEGKVLAVISYREVITVRDRQRKSR